MKKQKIFYHHKMPSGKFVQVMVKPLIIETKYEFKLNETEIFVIKLPLEDDYTTRNLVNSYINRLELN